MSCEEEVIPIYDNIIQTKQRAREGQGNPPFQDSKHTSFFLWPRHHIFWLRAKSMQAILGITHHRSTIRVI